MERETDSEQSSSDEEEEDEDSDNSRPGVGEEEEQDSDNFRPVVGEEEEEDVALEDANNGAPLKDDVSTSAPATKKGAKVPITISLKKVCKVCKRSGHEAGFKGAIYIDCPMKPCFLCKLPGHTTITCPHRVPLDHGAISAPRGSSGKSSDYVFERQIKPSIPKIKPAYVIPNEVTCGVSKYHSRRVTCLEFHPTSNNILLSGDKKGQLGVWDFHKVDEKTVYGDIHSCILNNMKFNPANDGSVYSASSDGTIGCSDLETGISETLMNLNPDGWQGRNSWRMLYGLDVNREKNLVIVADNFGFLYRVDARSHCKDGDHILIHKKGSKVTGLQCNPAQPDLLLSCGNDHLARLWDMRMLKAGSSLCELSHGRVVNSAYFSPQTGSKILTTSQDNRLRVWDYIFGDLETPSRVIVHSHDFNRHLTPFRAEWDPKDPSESLVVIGRYISENYRGTALHPIDFFDINTGRLVAEVVDPNISTISPVNKLHPREDVLASGSSRSIFVWKPKNNNEVERQKDEKLIVICSSDEKKLKKKLHGNSDDSDDDLSNMKKKSSKSLKGQQKVALTSVKRKK